MDRDERVVAWERADESRGHSLARVRRTADGFACSATEVLAGPEVMLSCSFAITLDAGWRTRTVRAVAFSADGETALDLVVDDDRRWWRDGIELPGLDGCVDVDVAATPLTNTFPIRRFADLAVGDTRTTPIAWVDVPALDVTRVQQTYRRLGPTTWEYSDPQHGAFVLEVDEDGLVTDYEGFARRVT